MDRVLVSAHRGGVGAERALENTLAGIERAVHCDCDCDYVEFDVRRFADGRIVLHHDAHLVVDGTAHPIARTRSDALAGSAYEPLDLDPVLAFLRGRKLAHVDLKLADGYVAATRTSSSRTGGSSGSAWGGTPAAAGCRCSSGPSTTHGSCGAG